MACYEKCSVPLVVVVVVVVVIAANIYIRSVPYMCSVDGGNVDVSSEDGMNSLIEMEEEERARERKG